jgi:hypothetical protein
MLHPQLFVNWAHDRSKYGMRLGSMEMRCYFHASLRMIFNAYSHGTMVFSGFAEKTI